MARPTNEGDGDNAGTSVVVNVVAMSSVVLPEETAGVIVIGRAVSSLSFEAQAIVAANKAVTMATNTMTPPR